MINRKWHYSINGILFTYDGDRTIFIYGERTREVFCNGYKNMCSTKFIAECEKLNREYS